MAPSRESRSLSPCGTDQVSQYQYPHISLSDTHTHNSTRFALRYSQSSLSTPMALLNFHVVSKESSASGSTKDAPSTKVIYTPTCVI